MNSKNSFATGFCLVISLMIFTPTWVSADGKTLLQARDGFKTRLLRKMRNNDALPVPPGKLFSIVYYKTPLGNMAALLSKPARKRRKYPAIIWITGGFPAGGIGTTAWNKVSPRNDQSAKVYRQSGMIMMYPFLRGASGNPGYFEGFYGEVNDVISAYHYLRNLKHVDPKRIYLGGHSTGATLALLVAASTNGFRGVFAFGPVAAPIGYGERRAYHDPKNEQENRLRAPYFFMSTIKTPVYIIEGTGGNFGQLLLFRKAAKNNRNIHIIPVPGADHFNILAPVNRFIARQIVRRRKLDLSPRKVQRAFKRSAR